MSAKKSAPLQALLDDRLGFYRSLKARIDKFGALAPIPEYESTVRYLQAELTRDIVVAHCKENSFAEATRQLVLNGLWHMDLDFMVSSETGGVHQHKPPAAGRFPNVPTQTAIDEALTFFDAFERSTKRGHDYHYQLDRYRYHSMTLPHLPGWFQLPTQDSLSLKDLIIMRSVPVGVRMVIAATCFLDAYFNSPKNAAVHDDNHSRRLNSENLGYFAREGITTDEEKDRAYEEFDKTIQDTILPAIEYPAVTFTPNGDIFRKGTQERFELVESMVSEVNNKLLPGIQIEALSQEELKEKFEYEINVRKAMTIICFELLHEYAKPPDRETLKFELMFQPDGPSAFEIVLRPGETPADLEKRRLDNKNLDSGAIFTHGEGGNTVYYFMDRGRNFLTSAFNKITHGFFDNHTTDFDEAPPPSMRTPELFADATERLMAIYNLSAAETGLTREKILALLTNGAVAGEKIGKNLETYPGHDPDNPLNKEPKRVSDHKESDAHRQGFLLG